LKEHRRKTQQRKNEKESKTRRSEIFSERKETDVHEEALAREKEPPHLRRTIAVISTYQGKKVACLR